MRRIFLSILVITLCAAAFANSPDIGNYKLTPGDMLEVFVIDRTGNNSFRFYSKYDEQGNIVLKRPDNTTVQTLLEGKAESGYIYWKNLNVKDMDFISVQDRIFTAYKDEFGIDTVISMIDSFSTINNISVTIGNNESSYSVPFEWGHPYTYYLALSEGGIIGTIDNDLYIVGRDGQSLEKVSPEQPAMPGDQLFLHPQLVSVIGYVTLPGVYKYNPGYSVYEYVSMGGGTNASGDLARMRIIDKYGHSKDKKEQINPGDIIIIQKSWWSILRDVSLTISVLSGIYAIYNIVMALI